MHRLSIIVAIIWMVFVVAAFAVEQPIVIYGDSRTNTLIHGKIVSGIMSVHPAVVFHVGDMVNFGDWQSEWDRFNSIVSPIYHQSIFYPVRGNHESDLSLYLSNFRLKGPAWYSVTTMNIRFIVLDSNADIAPDSVQYRWLQSELQNSLTNAKFTICLLHYPIFSQRRFNAAVSPSLDHLIPLFDKYHVAAVFSGHNHAYERFLFHKIYYIVTGGGCAPLADSQSSISYSQKYIKAFHFCVLTLKDRILTVDVFDVDQRKIDSFSLF